MTVSSFADIAADFNARVSRIVWCTITTVNAKGRPRSRILHPVWEGATGWIMTGRKSFKAKHLAKNPNVAVSYWDQQHDNVYAECKTEWADDAATKQHVWDLFKATPEPYGYDPKLFFAAVDSPDFGVLKLMPRRIELSSLADLPAGRPPRVWRA